MIGDDAERDTDESAGAVQATGAGEYKVLNNSVRPEIEAVGEWDTTESEAKVSAEDADDSEEEDCLLINLLPFRDHEGLLTINSWEERSDKLFIYVE